MGGSRFVARGLLAGFVIFVAAIGPAAAEWLVLEDGTRVETAGAWEVKGKVVVFTLAKGPLSSLRLSEVDLDATEDLNRRLREQAVAPRQEEPARRRKSTLILTDQDVGHVTPRSRGRDATDGGTDGAEGIGGAADGRAEALDSEEAAAADRTRTLAAGVEVTSWDRVDDDRVPGIVIEGELRNAGSAVAIRLQLTVVLRDVDGALLGTADALLGATTLAQRRRTRFRSEFPGVFSYGAVEFQLEHGDGALEGAQPPPEA